VPSGGRYARIYPFIEDTFSARTDETVKQNAEAAIENQKTTVGIKGPSVLSAVRIFTKNRNCH
jgi:hypothetical protein